MKPEQVLADYKAWTTQLNEVLEDLIKLAGEHNPQSPEMELLDECPKDHPHCCGHCEIIHRAREFKTNWEEEEGLLCPWCGDPMVLEKRPIKGDLYWECGFCDERVLYEKEES